MRVLRPISKILMLPPIGVFIYDLVKEWFVNNRFKIRSLEQWWKWLNDKSFDKGTAAIEKLLGAKYTDKLLEWPAPVSLVILPVILYVIYWVWFQFSGGHGKGFKYKSHD